MPKQDQRPQPQLLQPLLRCHQEALLLREDHHHQRYLRCLRSQVRIESIFSVSQKKGADKTNKNVQTWQACQHYKVVQGVQKGPK